VDALFNQAVDVLQRMQQLLAQATIDLPQYEIRAAQKVIHQLFRIANDDLVHRIFLDIMFFFFAQTIGELTEQTSQLRAAQAPAKKFSFKSRKAVPMMVSQTCATR
jgi:hypothetical protein